MIPSMSYITALIIVLVYKLITIRKVTIINVLKYGLFYIVGRLELEPYTIKPCLLHLALFLLLKATRLVRYFYRKFL